MSSLIANNWVLMSASAFDLLQYISLIKEYEENLASYRYAVGKE